MEKARQSLFYHNKRWRCR